MSPSSLSVAAACVVSMLAWWPRAPVGAPRPEGGAARPAAAVAAAPDGLPPAASAALHVAARPARPASRPAPELTRDCGLELPAAGATPASEPGAVPLARQAEPGARQVAARRRIDVALGASTEPFDRALGLWLDLRDDEDRTAVAQRLAQLAQASVDARLYGLALRSCWQRDGEACGALSARRWAELDPGNGVPWLYLLDEARRADDRSAGAEALAHLAGASRFDERDAAAVPALVAAAGGARDAAPLVELSVQAIGRSASMGVPYMSLADLCRDGAEDDANLAQACHAAATRIAARSDTVTARFIAAGIDHNVTGDTALRDRRRAELTRLMLRAPVTAPSSCTAARSELRLLLRQAEIGEVEALREVAGAG